MAQRCLKCFRPLKSCYCPGIVPVETGVKFVFLMHPVEAYKQRTGTGRLASLSLPGSEIIIGRSFEDSRRVGELLSDPSFYPIVLYPGRGAGNAESAELRKELSDRQLLIFLIDGTWIEARKMMHRSPCLQELPRMTFIRNYRSRFSIKTQPAEHCLSTIESVYYLIRELQETGICDPAADPEGLMTVFDRMVTFQDERRKKRFTANAAASSDASAPSDSGVCASTD